MKSSHPSIFPRLERNDSYLQAPCLQPPVMAMLAVPKVRSNLNLSQPHIEDVRGELKNNRGISMGQVTTHQ
jgi:hypothetical protein